MPLPAGVPVFPADRLGVALADFEELFDPAALPVGVNDGDPLELALVDGLPLPLGVPLPLPPTLPTGDPVALPLGVPGGVPAGVTVTGGVPLRVDVPLGLPAGVRVWLGVVLWLTPTPREGATLGDRDWLPLGVRVLVLGGLTVPPGVADGVSHPATHASVTIAVPAPFSTCTVLSGENGACSTPRH